jgi:hypothetical protein
MDSDNVFAIALLLLLNIGAIIVIGFSCDAIDKHRYVENLPSGTCDFHDAIYDTNYGSLYSSIQAKDVFVREANVNITIYFPPPPSWFIQYKSDCQSWKSSVQNSVQNCFYDLDVNKGYTVSIGIAGWAFGLALALLGLMVEFCLCVYLCLAK